MVVLAVAILTFFTQNLFGGGCIEGDCRDGKGTSTYADRKKVSWKWKGNIYVGE